MKKENLASIFWATIAVVFVQLVHNGREPLYLIAISSIPVLAALFYFKRSLFPLAIYLLLIGAIGRYTRALSAHACRCSHNSVLVGCIRRRQQ